MRENYLDFELPIQKLDEQLVRLKEEGSEKELMHLQSERLKAIDTIYSALSPWQKVQVARHQDRPRACNYIEKLLRDFTVLSGDRLYGDDTAIIGGMGFFDKWSIMVIGIEKGQEDSERVYRNFGMPHPEGYRKAQRLMRLAEKFKLPVVVLMDTQGAFPGIEAEDRGQAVAIATSMDVCLSLTVPLVTFIIGEGGSGGAIALSAANQVVMLEHSVYSVIAPEACSSIIWKDIDHYHQAANALCMTAEHMHKLGIIEHIVKEPLGGAHCDPDKMMYSVSECLYSILTRYSQMSWEQVVKERELKYSAL